ncbi:MAG: hypothetical protein CMI31_12635 [Opitutae bacterium]|nr:hypothetical protein [Opitutae bacterium]|tara:strand:- start:5768 stop:6562 length:795 start_codon:yes stop_codon:yes gene_type:complete
MKIIIPMAGESRRFKESGYDIPKPFLPIDDRPMIAWVCSMFDPEDEFIFIVRDEHARSNEYRSILENAAPHSTIVPITPHSQGPIVSSLAAAPYVKPDEPLLFSYCDFFQHWNYKRSLQSVHGADGGIPVFYGFQPASFGTTYYAYLRCDKSGNMLELREKEPFTKKREMEPASSGVYYVASWKLFEKYAQGVLDRGETVGSEYYLSLIFNPMVADGLRVTTFPIERFICWGTPEDYRQYLHWSNYFANDAQSFFRSSLKMSNG